MAQKLLTKESVCSVLDETEDVGFIQSAEGHVEFKQVADATELKFNDDEFVIDDNAFTKAARVVGIPASYVGKTPKELFISHLNHHYNQPDKNIVLAHKDNSIVDVTKKVVDVVSNREMFDKAIEAIGENEIKGFNHVFNDLSYTSVDIVCNKDFEAMPGDQLFGGVRIQNSILGESPIEVSAYIYRQVCSNGAIAPNFLYKWSRRNVEQDVMGWLGQVVKQAYGEVDSEFSRLRKLPEIKLGDHTSSVLKSYFRDWKLPSGLREEVMGELANIEGEVTLYDVWCAVAKVGTYSEKVLANPKMRRSVQAMAGDVIDHPDLCDTCHQKLQH